MSNRLCLKILGYWDLLFLDPECSSKEDIWLDCGISCHIEGRSLELAISLVTPPWISRWLLGGILCMNIIVKPDLWDCYIVPACGYWCQTYLALIALDILVTFQVGFTVWNGIWKWVICVVISEKYHVFDVCIKTWYTHAGNQSSVSYILFVYSFLPISELYLVEIF